MSAGLSQAMGDVVQMFGIGYSVGLAFVVILVLIGRKGGEQ